MWMTDLVEAIEAATGTTVMVGAGGKKSLLYALANRIDRAIVTATVRIPLFDEHVVDVYVDSDPVRVLRGNERWPIGLVPRQDRPDRYSGFHPNEIDTIVASSGADAILVKGDGARSRWLKAPNDSEPQIPPCADRVVPLVSAKIVDERLTDEHVHRPELVSALTGRALDDRITSTDVATVLTHPDGAMKHVPDGADVIPVINMVDGPSEEKVARSIASHVLKESNIPTVVLTKLIDDNPVVSVIDEP